MQEKEMHLANQPTHLRSQVDQQALLEWFQGVLKYLPAMPLKHNDRNQNLRAQIISRIITEFLADDERAEYLGLPKGCRIREGAKIISPESLTIGENCWIGENAILDASGGLEIGAHTSIGLSVYVWSHSSHLANLSMANQIGSSLIQRKRTKIGSGCFVSGPSVILPGATIGDNVLIRPFTTVGKDIPSGALVDATGVKEGVFTREKIQKLVRRLHSEC